MLSSVGVWKRERPKNRKRKSLHAIIKVLAYHIKQYHRYNIIYMITIFFAPCGLRSIELVEISVIKFVFDYDKMGVILFIFCRFSPWLCHGSAH